MPNPDEERLEAYLRQFRPLAPEPLPDVRPGRVARRWPEIARWAAVAATIFVLTVLVFQTRRGKMPPTDATRIFKVAEGVKNPPALTLGRANELLAHAQSSRAAFDSLAFQSRALPLSKGTQSALAALSKENLKL